MPAAIAIPLALGAGTATAGIVGAKLSSDASGKAADLTTQAANHAADVQGQGAKDTLAFQERAAQQDFLNAENAQHGNYDQFAARQGRLSTLGQMVGLKPFDIPAYRPLQQAPQTQAPGPMQGGPQAPPSYVAQPGAPALNPALMGGNTGVVNPNVTSMSSAFGSQPPAQANPSGQPMVTLRNQYGQTKQVPRQQASVYQGLGFQVVG